MFCRNCGNQIPDGVSFCPACGNATGTQTPVTTNNTVATTKKKKNTGAIIGIIAAIVVIIALVITLIIVLSGGNDDSSSESGGGSGSGSASSPETVIENYLDAFLDYDTDGMLDCIHDDIIQQAADED